MSSLDVVTAHGPVRGSVDPGTGIRRWKGIPFAAPPVGELRWRAPQPPQAWSEVRDSTRFGHAAPQPRFPMFDLGEGVTVSEDCLVLNVAAPPSATPDHLRPVMVWIHGGAYIVGSATQPLYDGARLVLDGDVVLVTVNHRLGPFGFLELGAFADDDNRFDSNLALRDVIAALEWVRDSIAAFGGDPDSVTVFGESAGGGMVTTLMTVPSARGLFHRAIAQSSPATSIYDAERARIVAEQFMHELGVGPAVIGRLRDLPVRTLLEASAELFDAVPTTSPGRLAFAPVVDGDLVPEYPVDAFRAGRATPVPLLIGTNKHEAALFRLIRSPIIPIKSDAIRAMFSQIAVERPELVIPAEQDVMTAYARVRDRSRGLAVARDLAFRMPTVWLAEGHSTVAPVYLYRWDWASPLLKALGIGATHATELGYVFGGVRSARRSVEFILGGHRAARRMSRRVQRRWTSFAATGRPTGDHADPVWPPYDTTSRAVLVIDEHDRVDDVDVALRSAWGDEPLSFR
ncbi:carboxylesterase/lipase family protein [Williamsia deligens]|uniref:Carboxylic ester hydrolase n=1 Tax=Williamsia deligens TaxID=321325 RepID=A0ABW3G9Z9_9NOCA|nr:carboxylesterase/lipase family protein [Williamsia deligens]MCP2196099.1 para-nitrobenzyl esterase [Williamsia deligens]